MTRPSLESILPSYVLRYKCLPWAYYKANKGCRQKQGVKKAQWCDKSWIFSWCSEYLWDKVPIHADCLTLEKFHISFIFCRGRLFWFEFWLLKVSLCNSPGYARTHSVEQATLNSQLPACLCLHCPGALYFFFCLQIQVAVALASLGSVLKVMEERMENTLNKGW